MARPAPAPGRRAPQWTSAGRARRPRGSRARRPRARRPRTAPAPASCRASRGGWTRRRARCRCAARPAPRARRTAWSASARAPRAAPAPRRTPSSSPRGSRAAGTSACSPDSTENSERSQFAALVRALGAVRVRQRVERESVARARKVVCEDRYILDLPRQRRRGRRRRWVRARGAAGARARRWPPWALVAPHRAAALPPALCAHNTTLCHVSYGTLHITWHQCNFRQQLMQKKKWIFCLPSNMSPCFTDISRYCF